MGRNMSMNWFQDTDGEIRWYHTGEKTLYMPHNLDRELYGDVAKEFIKHGYVVQLEII